MGVTNAREYAGRVVSPENAADFNAGLTAGDVASVFIGGSLTSGGASGMEAGIATMGVGLAAELPSGGSSTVVVAAGAITTALGATAVVVGTGMLATASSNLGSKKGHKPTNTNKSKEFGGQSDTNSKTQREAYRNAKDQNSIPRSQQPDRTTTVREKGTGKPLKQDEFTNSKGEKVQIRKDNPKTYPDGGQQGDHFNAGSKGEKLKQHHNF